MTNEEAINILYGIKADNLNLGDLYTKSKYDALGMAIKALEQEPCEDAISRTEVIKSIDEREDVNGKVDAESVRTDIVLMPSVTPTACIAKVTFDKDELQKIVDEKVEELTLTQEWIPVSERLPKESEYVGNVCKYYLIQDEYGDMHVAHYNKIGWIPIHSLKALGDEVMAWMPLPEPYKGESEEV